MIVWELLRHSQARGLELPKLVPLCLGFFLLLLLLSQHLLLRLGRRLGLLCSLLPFDALGSLRALGSLGAPRTPGALISGLGSSSCLFGTCLGTTSSRRVGVGQEAHSHPRRKDIPRKRRRSHTVGNRADALGLGMDGGHPNGTRESLAAV